MKKIIILFFLSIVLTGCSLFSAVKTEKINTYELNTLPNFAPKKHRSGTTLMVMLPDATPAYNTTQIAYARGPYEVAYFAKNSWIATPPQMLRPLIIQTLQKTHHYRAVIPATATGNYQYILASQLITLKQQFYVDSSEVVLVFRAQLTNVASNRIVASKEFTIVKPAAPTPYGGVVAANEAAAELLAQLANFCMRAR